MSNDDPKTLVSTSWLMAHLKDPDLRLLDASWYLPDMAVGVKNIVTLLLLTATGEIRTLCVATIVPVLSLMITRAGTSGLTSIPPTAAKKLVVCPRKSTGT